jgi:hypothetical protein
VFGIRVGAPLNVPACPDADTNTRPTCRANGTDDPGRTESKTNPLVATTNETSSHWSTELVILARSQRPDWASETIDLCAAASQRVARTIHISCSFGLLLSTRLGMCAHQPGLGVVR